MVGSNDLDTAFSGHLKLLNECLDECWCLILMFHIFLPPPVTAIIDDAEGVGKTLDRGVQWALEVHVDAVNDFGHSTGSRGQEWCLVVFALGAAIAWHEFAFALYVHAGDEIVPGNVLLRLGGKWVVKATS
ncbi:hypothetical protein PAXRUDRAFT_27966 [Paxillus rubicundulus Ve08.2h10]|uniref:Uncharacterized protein n=1 Tax=Paxillus rubicundulus Ve08.2h10 TaxID=930991 RepID=A0A0D0DAU4_9AGAM|nr:hypothetical protein PAXRUDRAFT_27966 [Paxillus rubicundulus Ve08.2h10]